MNSTQRDYRSKAMQRRIVGFSISFEKKNLLERGLGFEHVRELLIRLARPLLRNSASLAYAGHWEEPQDTNFTYILLRLISNEQEDSSFGGADTTSSIGLLYNHSAWPHYLQISRRIEAQWVDACRIVRITQEQAGFSGSQIATEADFVKQTSRAIFNAAVTLSAMRRLMTTGTSINIPGASQPEVIPQVMSRIMLGGRLEKFSGFLPGIFEEALVTLEKGYPLYILGGFGGAAEVLAKAILAAGNQRPAEFTSSWLSDRNKNLAQLLEFAKGFEMPVDGRTTDAALSKLFSFIERARNSPAQVLQTGLTDAETRELMQTQDPVVAVKLVRQGLTVWGKLPKLAA
jgi:SLOG cluster2